MILIFTALSSVNAADVNITNSTSGGLNKTVAGANNSDIINLDEGIYKNNVTDIVINKTLTIQGKNPQTTIIDAQNDGKIFNINENGSLTLINLKLINANGAIFNNGKITAINCIFSNNNGDNGGAIESYRVEEGTFYAKITNCTFIDNIAQYTGGAIYNSGGINLTVINSNFINNKAGYAGAINNIGPNIVSIINSTFIKNEAEYGGAAINYIVNSHESYMEIINSIFKENKNGEYGAAISSNGGFNLIHNCNFTKNTRAIMTGQYEDVDMVITGCNIFDNGEGILIMLNEYNTNGNTFINYNRIFNNTDNDLMLDTTYTSDFKGNADYNWWGSNNPDMSKIIGTNLNNYFVMNIINSTSLDSNGTVTFNYTFKLNTNQEANNSLLPYFTTDVYTNVTNGPVTSFDARFDRIFDVNVNVDGAIAYSFLTDNEIKSLEGIITLPKPTPTPNPDPTTPTPNPTTPGSVSGSDSAKSTDNYPVSSAAMKETALPINLILIILLSILGIFIPRKQN